jgi:hypothetical protein
MRNVQLMKKKYIFRVYCVENHRFLHTHKDNNNYICIVEIMHLISTCYLVTNEHATVQKAVTARTTGASSGAETAYPFRAHVLTFLVGFVLYNL